MRRESKRRIAKKRSCESKNKSAETSSINIQEEKTSVSKKVESEHFKINGEKSEDVANEITKKAEPNATIAPGGNDNAKDSSTSTTVDENLNKSTVNDNAQNKFMEDNELPKNSIKHEPTSPANLEKDDYQKNASESELNKSTNNNLKELSDEKCISLSDQTNFESDSKNQEEQKKDEEEEEEEEREKLKQEQQARLNEERERLMNQQNNLLNAANEVAARFYSSLNMLASRAFMNVKQEPLDMTPTGKSTQNLLSTIHNNYFGSNFKQSMTSREPAIPPASMVPVNNYDSSRMLRPLAELSPETFAEQLRTTDSASMVVYRPNASKRNLSSPDSPASLPNNRSSHGSGQGASGLHHFVTRYTIELPEDSSKLGVEVCLDNNNLDEPIIEVECGGNKGLLYVKKLCQGSKGQSILFNDEWITPNEFQFISGRETAKDWKRSIRHCGKSLKSMMTKGILMVHPPVCECDYCKGREPALPQERMMKKRPPSGLANDFSRSTPSSDSLHNAEPLTPSSSDVIRPLFHSTDSKIGREGGLSSIISQLHNKKSQIDSNQHDGGESLDLTMYSALPSGDSRKKDARRNEYSNRQAELNPKSGSLKRKHSNEDLDTPFPVTRKPGSNHREKNMNKEKRLRSTQEDREQDSKRNAPGFNERRSNDDRNGVYDLSRNSRGQTNNRRQPASKRFPVTSPIRRGSPAYNPNLGYAEYALYDAMKRAVTNAAAGSFNQDETRSSSLHHPNRPLLSDSPRPGRSGFINLDSTSPRALSSRLYDSPSPRNSISNPPMMELMSPCMKNGSRDADSYGPSGTIELGRHRNNSESYSPNKPPVTVLHHNPSYYDMNNNHHSTPHTHHYYPMPPPAFNHPLESRRYRMANERGKRESPYSNQARTEKRVNKGSAATNKTRQNGSSAAGGRYNIDLQNHAIPMMSLTYSKGKRQRKPDSRLSKQTQSNKQDRDRTNNFPPKSASSDDEVMRNFNNDVTRRLSSSVPPQSRPKNPREDFDNTRRTKSESPGSAPVRILAPKSATSWDCTTRPEFLEQFDDSLFDQNFNPKQQFSIDMSTKWTEISGAIEMMGELSVDDVCEFIKEIGCGQYEGKFREHAIDGDALPLLMEHHLVESMGMKLGQALKIIARVHRKLGSQCLVVMDRQSSRQGRRFSKFEFREKLASFPESCDSALSNSGDENIALDLKNSNKNTMAMEKK